MLERPLQLLRVGHKKLELVEESVRETLSVIYLDTEGFAASNTSEIYDANLFAVATILSSYLLRWRNTSRMAS